MNRRVVIGDIHGCHKTLVKLLESQINPGKDDEVYFVGDFIDRGPGSREVLDYILDMGDNGFTIFPVRGNHEDLCIKAFLDKQYLLAWYQNGAAETLKSFGVPQNKIYDEDALGYIPEKYIRFLSGLPYYYDRNDYIIVHAGLNLGQEDIFSDKRAMLWTREIKGLSTLKRNSIIVHGHTPMPIQTIRPNLTSKNSKNLNIDSGCVYKGIPGYGRLTALELDSRELFVQENID